MQNDDTDIPSFTKGFFAGAFLLIFITMVVFAQIDGCAARRECRKAGYETGEGSVLAGRVQCYTMKALP